MDKATTEVIDSQIVAENVGFLDSCFDNSFTLQCSLLAVKEYASEEKSNCTVVVNHREFDKYTNKKGCTNSKTLNQSSNRLVGHLGNSLIQNKSVTIENTNYCIKGWGLPEEIVKKYEQRGIVKMFEWQVSCLSNSKVLLDGCNLVYSAPTSAGKTLVAEILMIKTILERQKKVILILPFVSIVREKMLYLRDILSTSGIRVEGFMGSQSPPGGLQAVHVAICTIEKANSLVNKLLDDGSIVDLGAVIVDELHLLGDPHRGYILELLLTKIKYVSSKSNGTQVQIVGMSATLPNLEVLANWLEAELYVTQFRPISLEEYCLVGNTYYDKNGKELLKTSNNTAVDTDNVLEVCLETIKEGCSVLIFCMTKNRCETVAQSLASSFYKLGSSKSDFGAMLRQQLKTENIIEVLEQLKNCPVGLDQVLKNTIAFGVAYHHAGLTFDERDIVEGGFKSGAIRVLVATSTLSSGVNLPARKVVIRSPMFQRQPINIQTYKQMIGRAGRMGKDVKGESILICTEAEKKVGFDLMKGTLDAVKSCIESEDKFMRAVLEMIASQVACSKSDLETYCQCTLLFNQEKDSSSKKTLLATTLEELKNYELVRIQTINDEDQYVATALGKACLSSSMAPNDGLSLFCELQKARQYLVLETDLHLIYLVTPYSVSSQWADIDWLHMLSLWESLTKAMKRVGELVGVQESFIIRRLQGTSKTNNVQKKVNIHKRFYTALALQDLVNEVPLAEVANKFQCPRGFLQSLQQAAGTFAGMVTAFCHQLGWKSLELLISQFQDRLHFGIHLELLELMKLPSLNGMRARTLFDAGFQNIAIIASAESNAIENALLKAIPFQSDKEGDDKDDFKKMKKIKSIWITGYNGMTAKEASENLILEARKHLELEFGVAEIKWNKDNCNQVVGDVNKSEESNIVLANITSKLNDPYKTDYEVEKIQKRVVLEKELNKNTEVKNTNVVRTLSTHEIILKEKESALRIKDINTKNVKKCDLRHSLNNPTDPTCKVSVQHLPEKLKMSQIAVNSAVVKKGEEILWDSLNFTDEAFGNMSNVNTINNNTNSPNVSFGEVEENNIEPDPSVTKSSTKDISLFSSEGDNSSLFEDSLPIDCISSKILDDKDSPTLKVAKEEFVQTESVLDVFKSSIINFDDDEDIKLVYEDEIKGTQSEIRPSLNDKENLYGEIKKIEKEKVLTNPFKSPLKRQAKSDGLNDKVVPLTKRLKMGNQYSSLVPIVKSNRSEKYTLNIAGQKIQTLVLRDGDVKCNLALLNVFREVSIYLKINKATVDYVPIGSKIIKPKNNQNSRDLNCLVSLISGISIYDGHELCIYYDFTGTVNTQIKSKFNEWFSRNDNVFKLLSLAVDYNQFKKYMGIDLPCSFDASLAEWLLNGDEKIPNLINLNKKYCNIDLQTDVQTACGSKIKRYKDFTDVEEVCVNACSLWLVSDALQNLLLQQYHEVRNALDTEMKISRILANCEYFGVCVDKELASKLLVDVRNSQETLQRQAYKICGYHFNFNSSKDVAKVLGIYRGRKVSTKKSVLEAHNSPMSSIVIYWRKLNSILTKTLYPITARAYIKDESNRIHPSYTMFTCTGRISMHEPNLQNVPRTFLIPTKYLTIDNGGSEEGHIEFNCRNIFKAEEGCVLVSADYCQLEMRILTHYSKDPVLTSIMNSDMDVFRSIAASWGGVPEKDVDDDLRQKSKQLCYGIIYGMGNKTLSNVLDVSEMEAAVFMDTFYKTYPAIRKFTENVLEECRKTGYVETLMKRRRYLADITSSLTSKKNAAERQAVNTMIQGSAADIAKGAMCSIDKASDGISPKPRLILQMHDELIYEVPAIHKQAFVKIIKKEMESSVRLNVPLPVKVKSGYTWGRLQEISL